MKLIKKKKFAGVTLNLDNKIFVIYINTLNISSDNKGHHSKKAQIAYLKMDEVFMEVRSKYADFADVFLSKLTTKLFKYLDINKDTIELMNNYQPPYNSIYSLSPVELETLKAYIKNNLVNSFIKPFKSPAKALIFFNQKTNRRLRLCVDYPDLRNLTIKNIYLLLLVRELLNRFK